MYQALVKGKTVQENGYSGKLKDQSEHSKPLLLCGDTRNWEYFDQNAPDKYDKSKKIIEVFPDAARYGGALIRGNRYLEATPGNRNPGFCKGNYGFTFIHHDLITICDQTLQFDVEKWPVRDGGEVVADTDLDAAHLGRQSLVRVMLHEFAHYYGSRMEGSELKRHTLRFCTNLNKNQTRNKNAGKFKKDGVYVPGTLGNMGPPAATWTAETYAYFAIISYLEQWEWPKTEEAGPQTTTTGPLPTA
ncbi:hypothetical protein FVEG_15309 [Fusarium verticillioides 7600]|uniref:Uncharacterized protein n=1 Tax=Gibberella moniliformis (strain M3125 / FGSC 7600) TaxID=334819 RepID=W7M1X4_GIBM7|nr:hypothetical protein FVEG_15309 [Fusarium verticillioides 7600]EWG41565.1 hypothetical protein FVEG_15309 [Fusarium verticillioides 7600]